MKKSIIAAGAASIALAAMPVLGVFASTADVVDNLEVVVDPTCTLTRTGADGTDGTWAAADNEYSATISGGTTANLGTSTFKITCNDTTNGHQLEVAVTGLGNSSQIAYGSTAVSASANTWNITTTANATLGIAAGIVDATSGSAYLYGNPTKSTAAVDEAEFTAAYNVGVTSTLPAGTYTGTATYTLTYGS